jgi:ParB-like chromosome segregation protein Spo0J
MKVKLKNVEANPFRDMETYPCKQDKLEALKRSIEDTDFWENIVAREVKGGIEIAYGHHRLTALRAVYPATKEFNFIIRDLSDTEMAKIMAAENMEEWGSDADVEQETVRAIVRGYADGRIKLGDLPAKTAKTSVRYAPSFAIGDGAGPAKDHPYTTAMLIEFLGWNEYRVSTALKALALIESGKVKAETYKGLSAEQAAVTSQLVNRHSRAAESKAKLARDRGDEVTAKAAEKEAKDKAERVAGTLSAGFRNGSISKRSAGEEAWRAVNPLGKSEDLPEINRKAKSLANSLSKLLTDDSQQGLALAEVIKFSKHLDEESLESLSLALSGLESRCAGLRVALPKQPTQTVRESVKMIGGQ